jgi:DNA-directed RNA polymerase specialized sigma24 family protein
MTHEEIASLAGMTVSWSKSRLSRTRARVRDALNRDMLDEDTTLEPRTVGNET